MKGTVALCNSASDAVKVSTHPLRYYNTVCILCTAWLASNIN